MNKKKILFVLDSLHIGGAEKSLITLLSLLDYERFDVDLQLITRTGKFLSYVPREVNILPSTAWEQYIALSFSKYPYRGLDFTLHLFFAQKKSLGEK